MALPFLLADSSVMDEDGADFPYVAHALLRSRVVSFRLSDTRLSCGKYSATKTRCLATRR